MITTQEAIEEIQGSFAVPAESVSEVGEVFGSLVFAVDDEAAGRFLVAFTPRGYVETWTKKESWSLGPLPPGDRE